MLITDTDVFHDFIAIYCKKNGVPGILIQDMATKEYDTINVDNDVGEIMPMLNSNYNQTVLNFLFHSPFVYSRQYQYDHSTKRKKLVRDMKLYGP